MDRPSQSGRRPRAGPQPPAGLLAPSTMPGHAVFWSWWPPVPCTVPLPCSPFPGPCRSPPATRSADHCPAPTSASASTAPACARRACGCSPPHRAAATACSAGTSAAAPFVTGTAALLWSTAPDLPAARIRAALCLPGTARRASRAAFAERVGEPAGTGPRCLNPQRIWVRLFVLMTAVADFSYRSRPVTPLTVGGAGHLPEITVGEQSRLARPLDVLAARWPLSVGRAAAAGAETLLP